MNEKHNCKMCVSEVKSPEQKQRMIAGWRKQMDPIEWSEHDRLQWASVEG